MAGSAKKAGKGAKGADHLEAALVRLVQELARLAAEEDYGAVVKAAAAEDARD